MNTIKQNRDIDKIAERVFHIFVNMPGLTYKEEYGYYAQLAMDRAFTTGFIYGEKYKK